MSPYRYNIILRVLLVAIGLSGSSAFAANKMVELTISGDPGQNFSGDCYLKQRTGPLQRHRVKGQVPARFLFPALAFRCNLEKQEATGSLVATIIRDGIKEHVQKSRYPLKWVVVQSSGPWGHANGAVFASRPILR